MSIDAKYGNSDDQKFIANKIIIQKEKHEGYEHRAAKKRMKQTDVYVSSDNNKHTIHNLNFDNKINLIKLL